MLLGRFSARKVQMQKLLSQREPGSAQVMTNAFNRGYESRPSEFKKEVEK